MTEKYYDDDDVKYYVDEAKKDLEEYHQAIFEHESLIKLGSKVYKLKRVCGWDYPEDKPRYHEFVELGGDLDKVLTEHVIKENGYKGDARYDGPLYRYDALKIMSMGYKVRHERYSGVVFKMVDGVVYDHWEDEDEPDHWEVFEVKNYEHGDTLTRDQYIGWKVA